MSLLKTFVGSPLAGAIGWTLVHTLWEGALISGFLAAVLAVARSPRVRYAAACAALLMMLSGFAVTFFCVMPDATDRAFSRTPPGTQIRSENDSHVAISESPAPTPIVPWLAPLWIVGVSLIYLRCAVDCLSVRKLRTRGVCSAPERWQNEIARLSHRLRISRPILLLESSLADVPVVLGHFRPLILMPVGLITGLPPEQIEAILLHELAHIRRSDYLINFLQRLVEGAFFYHPAIWWISRVMRSEREHCCDDVVVFVSGNAHQYASALAAIEERRQSVVEPAVAATGGSVVKRIRRLLYPAKHNGAWAPFLAAAIFIVATAVSVLAWQSKPSSASDHAPRPATPATGVTNASPSLPQDGSDRKVEKFSFIMRNTSGTVSLACEHGCTWKTLSWSGQGGTDVFINDRGTIGGDNKEENSRYLIGIHARDGKMELSCKRGCGWLTLGYSPLSSRRRIDEYGVSGVPFSSWFKRH